MIREKILVSVGKAAQKIVAAECSNGNGSGLPGFVRNEAEFEIGDYDIRAAMAGNILKNLNSMGGPRPLLLSKRRPYVQIL